MPALRRRKPRGPLNTNFPARDEPILANNLLSTKDLGTSPELSIAIRPIVPTAYLKTRRAGLD